MEITFTRINCIASFALIYPRRTITKFGYINREEKKKEMRRYKRKKKKETILMHCIIYGMETLHGTDSKTLLDYMTKKITQ